MYWTSVLLLGGGFLVDSYDLFVINIVIVILKDLYKTGQDNIPIIATAALCGTLVGQLFFGILGDLFGKTRMFMVTLCLILFGSLASAFMIESSVINIWIAIAICRTFLGFGIGGEYPLSASLTSDINPSEKISATSVVFSMQGVGSVIASLLAYLFINVLSYDYAWRICLGFGAIPALLLVYPRYTFHKSHSHEKNHVQSPPPKSSASEIASVVSSNWKTLVGTAGSWFLLDVVFYANGIFSSTILEMYGDTSVKTTAEATIWVALAALPGYWFGIWIVRRDINLWKHQVVGFALIGLNFVLIMALWDYLHFYSFLALYGSTFFIINSTANLTTFIIPVMDGTFPEHVKTTCHGFSAACGKLGAIVGVALMDPLLDWAGIRTVLATCAVISFFGIFTTIYGYKNTPQFQYSRISDPRLTV